MALHSSTLPTGNSITYRISGASLSGAVVLGRLPVGYEILRASVKTHVAGTGSSSPTIAVGISGSANKYVTAAALTVSVGVATHTVIGTALKTADEELILTYGGTMPTNATYDATLVVELVRING
jgi:hypothetical protein